MTIDRHFVDRGRKPMKQDSLLVPRARCARGSRRPDTRHFLAAAALLAVATLCFSSPAALADRRGHEASLVGREAPEFTERTLAGGNLRLSEHRGDVVLVGFWASWCGTCREYLHRLGRMHDTYGSAGLVVIGVALDDDAARAASLAKSVDARFANVFDAHQRIGRQWRIGDVPTTVLVDRGGVVRHFDRAGDRDGESKVVEAIRALLDE
jgi:thiol-disulfide isomerase/thioredoxin